MNMRARLTLPAILAALAALLFTFVAFAQDDQALLKQVKEGRSYEQAGEKWRTIVLPPKLKKEQLIQLANALHRLDPESSFDLFDDDSGIERFIRSLNSEDDISEAWEEKHFVATVQTMMDVHSMKMQWQLVAMDGWKRYAHSNFTLGDKVAELNK
jgi:hypothetical protein